MNTLIIQDEDIRHFQDRLAKATDRQYMARLNNQIRILKEAMIAYKETGIKFSPDKE